MSQKKRGRPPKPTNQLSSAQRQVHVAQMDFEKLEQCYRHASGDASKRLWDGTGKLLSAAVSEILRLFVVMAQDGGGKKSKITALPPSASDARAELLKDPLFHHAVVLCGANSYKELRAAHLSITNVLPDYKAIWKAKVDLVADELIPHLEVHDVGFELDPIWMISRAVTIFSLWDASFVTLRWSFDGASVGVTVMGFSLIHPSIPSDTNYAFFPVALWRGRTATDRQIAATIAPQ